MNYLCSENKGADQLISIFFSAYTKNRFAHDAAHMITDVRGTSSYSFIYLSNDKPQSQFFCNGLILASFWEKR